MSFIARTLSLAAASLLLASTAQAADPLHAQLLQGEPSLRAAASAKAAAPQVKTAAASARTRAEVIAELRAARAAGSLHHAEAEIGWPVQAGKTR